MEVLIDTNIWSEGLRRSGDPRIRQELESLIQDKRAFMIGSIRQEVLSGIKEEAQYILLRDMFRAFKDLELLREDYELAAEFFNTCRRSGIQGSHTDFLICAAASRYQASIYTLDKDFFNYQKVLGIELYQPTYS